MKLSSMISGAALAVIVVLMLISVVSIYDATYGTISDLKVSSPQLGISDQGVYYSSNISGNNRGFMPTTLEVMNQSLSLSPGKNTTQYFVFPINLTNLYNNQWPLQNVTVSLSYLVSLVSYFFNASLPVKQNVTIPAPFYGFNVTKILNNSSTNNYSHTIYASFSYFFPMIMKISNISVLFNGTQIGNITLPPLSVGHSFGVSGNINLKTNLPTVNLEFKAGPLSWMVKDVKV